MKKEDFEGLQRGMAEAKAYLKGARDGFIVHEPVDVREVRARTDLKRQEFAERYRLDPRAVEQWEQGRRRPERGTEMYLRLIGQDPKRVAQMVEKAVRERPPAIELPVGARPRAMAGSVYAKAAPSTLRKNKTAKKSKTAPGSAPSQVEKKGGSKGKAKR